ncbi:unnamed protein product [Anisakis simplex]|uniref:Uncharacterized protein n=1 Tax=Anisakis simplex TaxID=6269 RepID=A0A3P6PRU8_ANISI|nr:unnamed protein product [Anisakis simplex]
MIFDIELEREHGSAQRQHRYTLYSNLSPSSSKSFVSLLEGGVQSINVTIPLPRFLLAPPLGDLAFANAINMALEKSNTTATCEFKQTYWHVKLVALFFIIRFDSV